MMLPPEPGSARKGADFGIPLVDGPSWGVIHNLAENSSLSRDGKAAVAHLLDRLEERLGASWLRRLYAKSGRLPPELLWFSSHVWVLPQFLTFAVQLEAVVDDPTFSRVLRVLKNEPSVTDWRHARLQLEVARTARAVGWRAEFEPSIPGSAGRGDLLLDAGDKEPVLVETTTLFRASAGLSAESFDNALYERIRAIERQHSLHATVDLIQQLDLDATNDWLKAIEAAAAEVSASGVTQEVFSPGGVVGLQIGEVPGGTIFSGVPQERDAILRLGKVVAGKAHQTKGPYPAWIRIDATDGLFGFTEWSKMPSSSERATMLAEAMGPYTDGHEHLQGVVYSSGATTVLGTTDPAIANASAQTEDGHFVRRLIAPHLARETIIVTLHPAGRDVARIWADAYQGEPTWLDNDLAALDLPPLAAFWT